GARPAAAPTPAAKPTSSTNRRQGSPPFDRTKGRDPIGAPADLPGVLVCGRSATRLLDHHHHRAAARLWEMHDALRHGEALAGVQLDGAVFQLDVELPCEHEE